VRKQPHVIKDTLSKLARILTRQKDPTKELAQLLRCSPEHVAAFEQAYRQALDDETPKFITDVSARQTLDNMAARRLDATATKLIGEKSGDAALVQAASNISARISAELVRQTTGAPTTGPETEPADFDGLPPEIRPQLTANHVLRDLAAPEPYANTKLLLALLVKFAQTGDATYYHQFRQGLDILDIDEGMYAMLGANPVSISHWLPPLTDAARKHGDALRIPETRICRVPLPILQLSRLEYETLTPTTLDIVNRWAYEAFGLADRDAWFVKTGTYSSKFDFRNSVVRGDEVTELGSYLLYIQSVACQMAGPLSRTSTYGVSTTNEWCVREYVEAAPETPTIYQGMPLRCEFRVFVDTDDDTVLGVAPYWREKEMRERFGKHEDADRATIIHDRIVYEMQLPTLKADYDTWKPAVIAAVCEMLPDLELEGQWSLDVMLEGDTLWAIDMAPLMNSALNDVVDTALVKPTPDPWTEPLARLLKA
jgi:hypothetical protein